MSAAVAGRSVLDETRSILQIKETPTVLGDLWLADPQLPTLLEITIRYPDGMQPPTPTTIRESVDLLVSALNSANAADLPASPGEADLEARRVSYAKLLHVLPLPSVHETPGTLDTFDPTASVPDISPYEVTYFLLQEGAPAYTLTSDAPPYNLTPFERLSLDTIETEVEDGA